MSRSFRCESRAEETRALCSLLLRQVLTRPGKKEEEYCRQIETLDVTMDKQDAGYLAA